MPARSAFPCFLRIRGGEGVTTNYFKKGIFAESVGTRAGSSTAAKLKQIFATHKLNTILLRPAFKPPAQPK
jgi:hypothetical protein